MTEEERKKQWKRRQRNVIIGCFTLGFALTLALLVLMGVFK